MIKFSSRFIWIAFAVLFIGSVGMTIFGDKGLNDLKARRAEYSRLVSENALLIEENSELYREVDRLNTDPNYIEAIARRELGLVREGELILRSQ